MAISDKIGKSAVCFQDSNVGLLPATSRDKDKYRLSSLMNVALMPTTSILYRVLEHKKLDQHSASAEAVKIVKKKTLQTRMWANAQRDGRPAEYRWRPLFNAAKFG